MEKYKTTTQDRKVFARFVRKWIKRMRLGNWSIYILHQDDDVDPDGDVAWIKCDHETLVCSIALSITWPLPATKELLELAAYHECLHLLLTPLMDHIKESKVARQEEHRLIVALERMQFGKALSEHGVEDG